MSRYQVTVRLARLSLALRPHPLVFSATPDTLLRSGLWQPNMLVVAPALLLYMALAPDEKVSPKRVQFPYEYVYV